MQETNLNEKHNGVGHAVMFQDGVGTQKTNGDFEDDGDIGDDENEEVCFIIRLNFRSMFDIFYNDFVVYYKGILQITILLYV